MLLKIKPLDAIFMRDSKPFEKGFETWANAVFPPYPSVMTGALRTVYFSDNIKELVKAGTEEDPTKNIDIGMSCISKGKQLYFPLPYDMSISGVESVSDSEYRKCRLQKMKKTNMISSINTNYYLEGYEDYEIHDGGAYISENELKEYLLNNEENFECTYFDLYDFLYIESKIGIARSTKTRTAEESMLYRIGAFRLSEDMSFIVDVNNLNIREKGILKLGGKGVLSEYREIQTKILQEIMNIKVGKRFRLYIATPAIFRKGWLPSWIDENSLEGTIHTSNGRIQLKLLTASIGRYKSIGGFDMAKKTPKEMYRAVPAGSVYYFEIIEGTQEQIVSLFNFKKISEERANEGFGFSLVGRVGND